MPAKIKGIRVIVKAGFSLSRPHAVIREKLFPDTDLIVASKRALMDILKKQS